MYAIQKQAKVLKKELKNTHIEAEVDGVKVIVTGEQELVSIQITDPMWDEVKGLDYGKKKLEEAVLKATNKAMKKAQEVASAKMKPVWEQMGVMQQ